MHLGTVTNAVAATILAECSCWLRIHLGPPDGSPRANDARRCIPAPAARLAPVGAARPHALLLLGAQRLHDALPHRGPRRRPPALARRDPPPLSRRARGPVRDGAAAPHQH